MDYFVIKEITLSSTKARPIMISIPALTSIEVHPVDSGWVRFKLFMIPVDLLVTYYKFKDLERDGFLRKEQKGDRPWEPVW
jgi:hypothetical protein